MDRLVSLVSDGNSSRELISEAVITLGSFAHGMVGAIIQQYNKIYINLFFSGTSENVQAVLSAKALPHLIKGRCSA